MNAYTVRLQHRPAPGQAVPATDPEAGYACPRYERCTAAFCPALGGKHLRGERVCYYLMEAVKPGGEARLRGIVPAALLEVVLSQARKRMLDGNHPGARPPLTLALIKASRTGSRIELYRTKAAQLNAFRAKGKAGT